MSVAESDNTAQSEVGWAMPTKKYRQNKMAGVARPINWLDKSMKVTIRTAVFLLLLGCICWGLSQFLPVFAPCRIFYRVHNSAQDSLACHIFSFLGLVGLISVFAGGIIFLGVACSTGIRRMRTHGRS